MRQRVGKNASGRNRSQPEHERSREFCYENAKAEAFFSTFTAECFLVNQVFGTKTEARREIFEYIEVLTTTNEH